MLAFCSTAFACSLFNITSIKSSEYTFIQKGDEPGKVQYKIDEFGLDELTCYVYVFDDKICTVDNVNKRIQVMQSDGTIELIIGTIPADVPKKVRTSKFKFIKVYIYNCFYTQHVFNRHVFLKI